MAVAVFGVLAVAWIQRNSPTEQSLLPVLTDIDRIRVRTGGTCHRNPSEEQQLFEEKDASQIQSLIQAIHIDPPENGSIVSCNCCGNPSIEFYRGEELIVTLGCQHGETTSLAGRMARRRPFDDRKYKVVEDMDGHSWGGL